MFTLFLKNTLITFSFFEFCSTYHTAFLMLEAIEKNTIWIKAMQPEGKISSIYKDAVLVCVIFKKMELEKDFFSFL